MDHTMNLALNKDDPWDVKELSSMEEAMEIKEQ